MKRTEFRKGTLVLAGLALAVVACFASDDWVSAAHAQQSQGGRSAGATHEGNQGITPGGAGGISNPAPGGGPTSLGGPQQSAGPRASETNRPGYLGGYVPPDAPDDGEEPPPEVITNTVTETQVTLPHESVCEDLRGGFRNPSHRMTGVNGDRLDLAGTLVHPDIEAREVQVLRLLVANFQEEMQKRQPDALLAGTYLGVVADVPVTEEMVMQLGESLCVPVQRQQAASIAGIAETQRQKLISERSR